MTFRSSARWNLGISAIVTITLIVLGSDDAAAGQRPFCLFSKDGWKNQPPTGRYVEYIVRQANKADRSGIPQVVNSIRRALDVRAEFDVYIAKDENNAFATVANGRKILVVDVEFLERINKIAKTDWGAISIVAHEVGHHVAGFSGDSHTNELNADYWSGYILQRLGSATEASTKAILTVGTEQDTQSHPNKYKRSNMIEKGWNDARQGRPSYQYCDGCKPD